jgi:hypothetical protein
VAADLGIATSCLRRWMKQDEIDGGRREGLSTDERADGGIPEPGPRRYVGCWSYFRRSQAILGRTGSLSSQVLAAAVTSWRLVGAAFQARPCSGLN